MKFYLQQVAVLGLLCISPASIAIPIDSIVAKSTSPIAPRGGVMMVRLLSHELGNDWPASIPVTFADDSMTNGIVGWIESKPASSSWTDDTLLVRPILSSDTTASIHPKDRVTGPVLLLQLPENGYGEIYFGAEGVVPKWMDLPARLPQLNLSDSTHELPLYIVGADHLPSTGALHYWRWVLLASRLGVEAPKIPIGSEVESLAAQHGEQLWRIALHNLSVASRGVAADCRDLLTDSTSDGAHLFACWVENQNTLEELLGVLLNTSLTSKQLKQRALRWVDRQSRSLFWFDSIFGNSVTLKFANCKPESSLCVLTWEGDDEIPLPLEVPAHSTGHITLERPQELDLSVFGPIITPQIQNLTLAMQESSTVFPIENGVIDAKPPRYLLPKLASTWTLSSLRHGYARPTRDDQSTTAEVRYVMGHWEIFVRCRGNVESFNKSDRTIPIGEEAITLLFPALEEPVVIRPNMKLRQLDTVFTHVVDDGWNARMIIPDSLIRDGELVFSIARTHGGSNNVETSPLPCVPWNLNPGSVVINTKMWNTIDNIPITPEPE